MTSLGRAAAVFAASAAMLLPVTACTGPETEKSTAPVVVPGRPGEEADVLPPGSTFTPDDGLSGWNEADAAFMAGMIPHHEQAITMAQLAPGRAQHPQVLGLADRIADVQGAEIDGYRRWLSERGLGEDGRPGSPGSDGGSHGDHGTTTGPSGAGHAAGMASAEELDRLEDSSGTAFDRLWLELMIRHHQGALDMAARRERDGGTDVRAGELAADVTVTQLDEIHRMEDLLAGG